MKIGSAWTKQTKEDGRTFISTSLDEAFLELCPQLKGLNLTLSYIDAKDRKSDKSPGWIINLTKSKQQTQGTTSNEAEVPSEEEIPY